MKENTSKTNSSTFSWEVDPLYLFISPANREEKGLKKKSITGNRHHHRYCCTYAPDMCFETIPK
jgi:hypothetical protein